MLNMCLFPCFTKSLLRVKDCCCYANVNGSNTVSLSITVTSLITDQQENTIKILSLSLFPVPIQFLQQIQYCLIQEIWRNVRLNGIG